MVCCLLKTPTYLTTSHRPSLASTKRACESRDTVTALTFVIRGRGGVCEGGLEGSRCMRGSLKEGI